MIPMTLTEKIIARAAGLDSVQPGDEVWATADRMTMNDTTGPRRIAGLVEELGGLAHPHDLCRFQYWILESSVPAKKELPKRGVRFPEEMMNTSSGGNRA